MAAKRWLLLTADLQACQLIQALIRTLLSLARDQSMSMKLMGGQGMAKNRRYLYMGHPLVLSKDTHTAVKDRPSNTKTESLTEDPSSGPSRKVLHPLLSQCHPNLLWVGDEMEM